MRSAMIGVPLENFGPYCRKAAAEGAVLLKNEDHMLPICKGEKVAVFGRCQINFYRSGTGSGGSVNVAYTTNLLDSLKESGVARVDEELEHIYRDYLLSHPFDDGGGRWAAEPWNQVEMPVSAELCRRMAEKNEKALIVIGRTAGEAVDYSNQEGSYLLTQTEREMIRNVTAYFEKVCVIMNVSNAISMSWAEETYVHPVSSILYVWQGGIEGGNAAADVICGKVTPSGKLADTIAYHTKDYPSDKNNGSLTKNIYQEDIYVGYRYFETFSKDAVQYPFGFGLSYTTFSYSDWKGNCSGDEITVSVKVTNTGDCYSGKEVVQVYYQAPQGKLGRPERALCAFCKTKLLLPGESQVLSMTFPIRDMAAYDDLGVTGAKSAYVLEKGEYRIWAGGNVRNLTEVPVSPQGGFMVSDQIVCEQCKRCSGPEETFNRMVPGKIQENGCREILMREVPAGSSLTARRISENLPAELIQTGNQGIRLRDVKDKKATMEQFVAQLSDDELCTIVRGEGMCSPKATPGIASVFGGVGDSLVDVYQIPVAGASDGPSGIRMDVGAKATQVPIGTLLACTFNTELVEELYEQEGRELLRNEIDTLLGPGINIHRHPLNGRNFEYFSEDPLLTGKMAAAVVRGIAKYGPQATIKHMSCNSQETNRHAVNAVVSERALREIYLKGFEIAVKEGHAKSIMTSYNPVNGHWSASNYDINTTILRGEWNYDGIVMTDWWAEMNDPVSGGEPCRQDAASMIRSQNDLYMVVPNYGAQDNLFGDNLKEKLETGSLTRGELQRSAINICRFVMNAPVMNRGNGDFRSVEHVAAGNAGKHYKAGMYTIYVTMHMDDDVCAQASSNLYLNGYLLAPVQTNGTEGRSVRRMLGKAELEDGLYEVTLEAIKAGIVLETVEFIPDEKKE